MHAGRTSRPLGSAGAALAARTHIYLLYVCNAPSVYISPRKQKAEGEIPLFDNRYFNEALQGASLKLARKLVSEILQNSRIPPPP